jgi:hypothetical protein
MEDERNVYKILMGNPKGNDHSEDQGIDGRMSSKWILGRLAESMQLIHLPQDLD